MSPIFIGLMLGAGVATWVYNKIYRSTGGNSKNAAIVAGIAGVGSCLAAILIYNVLF